jgi:hypothetical protein
MVHGKELRSLLTGAHLVSDMTSTDASKDPLLASSTHSAFCSTQFLCGTSIGAHPRDRPRDTGFLTSRIHVIDASEQLQYQHNPLNNTLT